MSDPLGRLTSALADRYSMPVAIKVLQPELAAAIGTTRFLREIEITARLDHPHIQPVFDSGASEGFLYYVMPYVEGESLRDRIRRDKQLPLDDAMTLAREVADALSYAHARGVIHRDIKPENIMPQSGRAVVTDFGIAQAVDAAGGDKLTETGMAIGTPQYMSPEQAAGEQDLDGRSDLYALACVLYEMLAGDPPYTGPNHAAIMARHAIAPIPRVRSVRPAVPDYVDRAVCRGLGETSRRQVRERDGVRRGTCWSLAIGERRPPHAVGRWDTATRIPL